MLWWYGVVLDARMEQTSGGLFFVRGKAPIPARSALPTCPLFSVFPQLGSSRVKEGVCHVRLKAERAGSKTGIAPYKEMG